MSRLLAGARWATRASTSPFFRAAKIARLNDVEFVGDANSSAAVTDPDTATVTTATDTAAAAMVMAATNPWERLAEQTRP